MAAEMKSRQGETMVVAADNKWLKLSQMRGDSGGTGEMLMGRQGWTQQAAGGQEATGTTTASDNGTHRMAAGG